MGSGGLPRLWLTGWGAGVGLGVVGWGAGVPVSGASAADGEFEAVAVLQREALSFGAVFVVVLLAAEPVRRGRIIKGDVVRDEERAVLRHRPPDSTDRQNGDVKIIRESIAQPSSQ